MTNGSKDTPGNGGKSRDDLINIKLPNITISFDREKAGRLKQSYNVAVRGGFDTFKFEGDEFVTNYAKYLLEYLNERLI